MKVVLAWKYQLINTLNRRLTVDEEAIEADL
jgi:hypothetical protein